MKPITVIVCDDSALIRHLFSKMLNEEPDIEVVGTAADPLEAREKIKQLNPRVLTLDIEMPNMDGLSFLEKIMSLRPMPVIMASTLTQKGAAATLRALELGAVDVVSKPAGSQTGNAIRELKDDLVAKVRAAAQANVTRAGSRTAAPGSAQAVAFHPPAGGASRLIAIGSSTGGVEALRDVFQVLPANVPPIVITQHMPAQFTPSFAARLASLSQVKVSEAVDGAALKSGHAYLAPGGKHLTVVKSGQEWKCRVEEGEPVSGHCPSVDVLFTSVAAAAGDRAVGVILTGMGKDGAAGMLRMRESGAYNVGQNQASCVVYGMPKAAAAAGAVHEELPLSEIAAHVLSYCAQERRSKHAS